MPDAEGNVHRPRGEVEHLVLGPHGDVLLEAGVVGVEIPMVPQRSTSLAFTETHCWEPAQWKLLLAIAFVMGFLLAIALAAGVVLTIVAAMRLLLAIASATGIFVAIVFATGLPLAVVSATGILLAIAVVMGSPWR